MLSVSFLSNVRVVCHCNFLFHIQFVRSHSEIIALDQKMLDVKITYKKQNNVDWTLS